ncbi:hypothetical protein SDC9_97817 [bioreactor metagenome]|uniref:Uncharacterized protein n=1 Tax=bioreactor metagenome TaxID=1076179 RepID=A0A645AFL8_9ZZZZ
MRCYPANNILPFEPPVQNIVQNQQAIYNASGKDCIGELEIVFKIEHVEILDHRFIRNISRCVTHRLIKNRKCVTHPPIRFLCDNI